MEDFEPAFGPRNRMLSYISEGIEEDFDDDTAALDDSGRSSKNGIRASVFLRSSMLEAVQEDDSMTRSIQDRSVYSSSDGPVESTASLGSRSGGNSSSRHSASLSSSFTSQSKSLRSSIQSTGSAHSHVRMNGASSPLVFTQHSLPQGACCEVNMHETNYFVGTDESLPQEYSDASLYDHELILPPKEQDNSIVSSEEENDDYRMLSLEDKWSGTVMFTSQRKLYALFTVLGAVSLCISGIIFAVQVLETSSSMNYTPNFNAEYFYLPRYEFGGGSGGIEGIREDGVRRVEDKMYYEHRFAAATTASDRTPANEHGVLQSSSAKDAPKLVLSSDANPSNIKLVSNNVDPRSSLRSNVDQDQFSGFGPRQFNPTYDGNKPQAKALLTSSVLSSYTPPEENNMAIVLDPMFNGAMMDVSDLPVNPDRDMPVIWDIPMTGISKFHYALGHCLKLVQCSHAGKDLLARQYKGGGGGEARKEVDYTLMLDGVPSSFDPPLKVDSLQSLKFVNVDCSTPHGIDRGVKHELATSNMVDVIYSSDVHDAARLFAPPTQAYGRGIVMMRHPVERVVASYEYLKFGGVGSTSLKGISLEQYAISNLLQDNPLTRSLSGAKRAALQESDLEVAKEILKRKFIIGLYDNMHESMARFELYFGWHLDADSRSCQCSELQREESAHYNRYAKDIGNKKEVHPGLTDSALKGIMVKNKMDLLLYDYSRFLFNYQGRVLFEIDKSNAS